MLVPFESDIFAAIFLPNASSYRHGRHEDSAQVSFAVIPSEKVIRLEGQRVGAGGGSSAFRRIRIDHGANFFHEVSSIRKISIDTGEADIGNLVEFAKMFHDQFTQFR